MTFVLPNRSWDIELEFVVVSLSTIFSTFDVDDDDTEDVDEDEDSFALFSLLNLKLELAFILNDDNLRNACVVRFFLSNLVIVIGIIF